MERLAILVHHRGFKPLLRNPMRGMAAHRTCDGLPLLRRRDTRDTDILTHTPECRLQDPLVAASPWSVARVAGFRKECSPRRERSAKRIPDERESLALGEQRARGVAHGRHGSASEMAPAAPLRKIRQPLG